MAAACGQPLQQALEPLHSVPVLRQHPAVDGVGQSAEAVELQFKEPRRVVERLLGTMGMMGFWGLGHWRRGLVSGLTCRSQAPDPCCNRQ